MVRTVIADFKVDSYLWVMLEGIDTNRLKNEVE